MKADFQLSSNGGRENVLEVHELKVQYDTHAGSAEVLSGVELTIGPGEIVGLVGESGAGKSMLVWAIVGLLRDSGRVTAGEILFRGQDLCQLSEPERHALRGKEISMVMQNARSALDPLAKIGEQIASVYRRHVGASSVEARAKALEMIRDVQIPDAERVAESRAHELSGGMAQRISIAMALVCSPTLLLADEPTTGLDVTVQRQILDLIRDLVRRDKRALLLVTHDLGVVAHYCDKVAVLYGGRVIEFAEVETFFASASHPYSLNLIGSVSYDAETVARSATGTFYLDLTKPPSGCYFHPACPLARDHCREVAPALLQTETGHYVRCHYPREARERVHGAAA